MLKARQRFYFSCCIKRKVKSKWSSYCLHQVIKPACGGTLTGQRSQWTCCVYALKVPRWGSFCSHWRLSALCLMLPGDTSPLISTWTLRVLSSLMCWTGKVAEDANEVQGHVSEAGGSGNQTLSLWSFHCTPRTRGSSDSANTSC